MKYNKLDHFSFRPTLSLFLAGPAVLDSNQGILKGEVDLLFDWFGISCMTTDNFCFYLQNRPIQAIQTGGQLYSDTYPFSIPWLNP